MLLVVCLQALAGPRVPDHLHHRSARHAEAEGGVVALAAQLPKGHGVFLGGARPRPPAPENHLPQEPHQGGCTPEIKTDSISENFPTLTAHIFVAQM